MSTHKECGATIRWALRSSEDERYFPPLEYIDRVFIITEDNVAIETSGYQVHHCDPDKVIVWQEYCERLAEATGKPVDNAYQAARELEREQRWEVALRKKCPRCDQPRKKKCISLSRSPKLAGTELRNPHPERLDLIGSD